MFILPIGVLFVIVWFMWAYVLLTKGTSLTGVITFAFIGWILGTIVSASMLNIYIGVAIFNLITTITGVGIAIYRYEKKKKHE